MRSHTIAYTVEYKAGTTWVRINDPAILDVSITNDQNHDGVISFGDESTTDCTIRLVGSALSAPVRDTPFRVQYQRDTITRYAFQGVSQDTSRSMTELTIPCTGFASVMRNKKLYSRAWFRRPVATKTRVDSNPNPDDPAFSDGIINWILLKSGGWPAERDFDAPASTIFLFQCDQALLTPEWTWVAGDDAWEECKTFAAATGGQIYQTQDGVIRFVQPLATSAPAQPYTFDASVYRDIQTTRPSGHVGNVFRCPYTPRAARPLQEVYNDAPYQVIPVGQTHVFELAPKFPLKQLETVGASGSNLPAAAMNITYVDGGPVPYTPTAFTHRVLYTAQSVTLTITNTGTKPFIVNRLILRGEPITAGEPGIASVGSGAIAKELPQNPNIQSASHAQRLCRLHALLNDRTRDVFTLIDCPYDPRRVIGERVHVTVSMWGVTNRACVITGIQIDETGLRSTYTALDVSQVPSQDAYFLIGTTNYTGQTRRTGI